MAKIVVAIRSVAHFSYLQSSIDALIDSGHDLRFFFDQYWSTHGNPSRAAFEEWKRGRPEIENAYFPVRKGRGRRKIMFVRELRSFNSYCRRPDEFKFYRERWLNYLGFGPKLRRWVGTRLGRRLLGSAVVRKLTTYIERRTPAAPNVVGWLRSIRPDAVLVSPANMRFCEEVEILKAAKELRIPSFVPVLTWDNMSTKGLIHVPPTRLLAWHHGHAEYARKYHYISTKTIRLVGAPFFDKWFDIPFPPTKRKSFLDRVGLDPERPYVLYLGSSANIAKDETWFVKALSRAFADSTDPMMQRMQILFRGHPANAKNGLALLSDGIGVWPREGTLPDSRATFRDFRDSLEHALCVVGINTSGMLDSIIYDRAVVSPIISEYDTRQEKAEHFRWMQEYKAIAPADSAEEVVQLVSDIASGKDDWAEPRRKFVTTFIRPHGLEHSAAQRIVAEIEELIPRQALPSGNDGTEEDQKEQQRGIAVRNAIVESSRALEQKLERARSSDLYQYYLSIRDRVLWMIRDKRDQQGSIFPDDVCGFEYLFDASPLLVFSFRRHCYHVSNDYSESYADQSSDRSRLLLERLDRLLEADGSELLVPESEALGGFGYPSSHGMINLETLKFYESLIGLNRAGFMIDGEVDGKSGNNRLAVVEIGSGWGGFAYQFRTLFPNTTCFLIDAPAKLLFAATYLRATFPEARLNFIDPENASSVYSEWTKYDFVFVSSQELSIFSPHQLDLAVDIGSLQEMPPDEGRLYVHRLADLSCRRLYSVNRDPIQSGSNQRPISYLISERYNLNEFTILDPACAATTSGDVAKMDINSYSLDHRHYSGNLR